MGRGKCSPSHPPRHRGRCGPPRPSCARWLTPPGSPAGRSPSTQPTAGAVWGQTSGPEPARQGEGRPHRTRGAGVVSATASATLCPVFAVLAAAAAVKGDVTMPSQCQVTRTSHRDGDWPQGSRVGTDAFGWGHVVFTCCVFHPPFCSDTSQLPLGSPCSPFSACGVQDS